MSSQIDNITKQVEKASTAFNKAIATSETQMYDEAVTLIKTLDVDGKGRIVTSVNNLKRLAKIRARLAKVANNKEYLQAVKELVKSFDTIYNAQQGYFAQLTNGMADAAKYKAMKEIAIDNTVSNLTGAGLQANVTDKINDMLLKAVTTGAKFSDLTKQLNKQLTGLDEGTGVLSRYAKTYATTALSQFVGQNNKLLTDDLGCEWFMYTGGNIETTREFCEHLTAKKYIHKSEIPEILKGLIDGHQCRIYDRTGLPYGMIEGTNEDNFQVNVGGWNCGHQLVPVAKEAVPEEVRKRVEKNENKYGGNIPSASPLEIAKQRHAQRTKAQADAIREKWSLRKDELQYSPEQRTNFREIEKALGIKRGLTMTVEEADKQNANPNYGKKGCDINCQTCSPAYLLRLRGFRLWAKPNTTGSKLEYLSRGLHNWEKWLNADGTPAAHIRMNDWIKRKGYKTMTQKRYMEFFEETCTEVGVYELSIGWKSRGGHSTILQRFADGSLRRIEAQMDNSKGGRYEYLDIDRLCQNGIKNIARIHECRGIMRIDNKLFNPVFLEIFDK